MKKSRKSNKHPLNKPRKSSDIPVTSGMLYAMEDRLVHRVDAGFDELRSAVNSVKAELHRVALMVEDQNARNKYVLDGYAQIYDLIAKRNKDV